MLEDEVLMGGLLKAFLCQHDRKQCNVDNLDTTLYSKLSSGVHSSNGDNTPIPMQGRGM